MKKYINVTDHFPEFYGLKRSDSPFSAEALREDFLVTSIESLNENESIIICIDNQLDVIEYGASYLQEAFVGLVSHGHFTIDFLNEKVEFSCLHDESVFYIKKINEYLKNNKKQLS